MDADDLAIQGARASWQWITLSTHGCWWPGDTSQDIRWQWFPWIQDVECYVYFSHVGVWRKWSCWTLYVVSHAISPLWNPVVLRCCHIVQIPPPAVLYIYVHSWSAPTGLSLWLLQMPWGLTGTRSSAATMLTQLWLWFYIDYIMQLLYHVATDWFQISCNMLYGWVSARKMLLHC